MSVETVEITVGSFEWAMQRLREYKRVRIRDWPLRYIELENSRYGRIRWHAILTHNKLEEYNPISFHLMSNRWVLVE